MSLELAQDPQFHSLCLSTHERGLPVHTRAHLFIVTLFKQQAAGDGQVCIGGQWLDNC